MRFFWFAALLLGLSPAVLAENYNEDDLLEWDWKNNFGKGQRELTAGGVAYFSPANGLDGRPTINYAGAFAQLGYMINDLGASKTCSGNFEGIIEGYGASIFRGRGSYMTGTTLWLRYNVVPSRWKIVPYFQGGSGITLTDVDRDLLGQTFNFNLNLATGVRWFIGQRCSLNGEYRFQHVSNAGMAENNSGIDAQAAVLSMSWFF